MKRILRICIRRAIAKEICNLPFNVMDVDVKVELSQALILIGLWHVKEVLEQEVRVLVGERYQRQGVLGPDRWGEAMGFGVFIGSEAAGIGAEGERSA
jgi:hypothetical protein